MGKMLSDSILDLGKCPYRKRHESESACFPVGTLPKVQNRIWKHFSHKVLYNYNSKFFFVERFGLYLTKSKNGFPIVFYLNSKVRVHGLVFLFQMNRSFLLENEKKNTIISGPLYPIFPIDLMYCKKRVIMTIYLFFVWVDFYMRQVCCI